jgi:hypothetical protein
MSGHAELQVRYLRKHHCSVVRKISYDNDSESQVAMLYKYACTLRK